MKEELNTILITTEQAVRIFGAKKINKLIKKEEPKKYTKEDLRTAWNSSEQNMRFQFSSSVYKNITFEKWFNQFKKEK